MTRLLFRLYNKDMTSSPFKKIISSVFLVTVFLLPISASAQTTSGLTNWLSSIFNWQKPIIGRMSNLFEARKDSVENNNIERNRLLDWRRGVVPLDSSSSDSSSSSTTTQLSYPATLSGDASTSPVFIPLNIFQEKKSAITVELFTALNSLETNAGDLADFIATGSTSGNDMTLAQNALDQANVDINNANQSIGDFENYEPDVASSSIASSSDMVNLQVPQSYLDTATMAIRTAKDSLESAITAADNSL